MTRTLLLGVDGVDPDLADEFDLPNLESIGEFQTIDTYGNSGPSWATVMTGLRPNDHGVHKLEPGASQSWQGEPIWEKIDGYCGVANVPLTYPPSEIGGWMVSSMMTPKDAIYTYPRELYRTLDDMGYRIDVWTEEHENHPHGHYGVIPFEFSQEYRDDVLDACDDVIERRGFAFTWLLTNEPVDFAFVCFTALDRVQHIAYDDRAAVEEKYQRVDEQVGRILDTLPESCDVIATSDHGFQRIDAPDTDMTGEHRIPGWAATTLDVGIEDLHDVHYLAVSSANRDGSVEDRLRDLGYID